MEQKMFERLKRVADEIKKAKSVAVLTGAGISKASGIPTFRDKDGLWKKFSFSQFATYQAFRKNPKEVWSWYNYRKKIIKQAKPNPAHEALAELEQRFKENFTLITQNIDNLHYLAGNRNIIELHGNIFKVKCTICDRVYTDDKIYSEEELPPKCKYCGGLLRPFVVWFGENLDRDLLDEAIKSATSDVFLCIGTSGAVQPAASLPKIAHDMGRFVAEFNIDYSGISIYADEVVIAEVTESLPQLIKLLDS